MSCGTSGWDKYETVVMAVRATGLPVWEVPDCGLEQLGQQQLVRGHVDFHLCHCGYDPDNPDETCPCCRGECDHFQRLRIACFDDVNGNPFIIEEWLERRDCCYSGIDVVGVAVYAKGQRPVLVTKVLEPR